MIHRTKAFVRLLGLALGLLLVVGMSWAADPYPTRAIRWVVPWPAGGVADTQARIIADQLGKALGQQVMIDNRTGASGVLGADAVAKSKPDGYTLLYVSPNEQASVEFTRDLIADLLHLTARYASEDGGDVEAYVEKAVRVAQLHFHVEHNSPEEAA